MARKHHIAMAGLSGCIPDSCNAYSNKRDAENALIELAGDDMPRGGVGELRRTGSVDINGGGYVLEVVPCTCDHPEVHNDNGPE